MRLERQRLLDDKLSLERALLDGARGQTATATGRPIRLRIDRDDLVTGLRERVERRHGEWRSAGKDEAQGASGRGMIERRDDTSLRSRLR